MTLCVLLFFIYFPWLQERLLFFTCMCFDTKMLTLNSMTLINILASEIRERPARRQFLEGGHLWADPHHVHLPPGLCCGGVRLCGGQGCGRGAGQGLHPRGQEGAGTVRPGGGGQDAAVLQELLSDRIPPAQNRPHRYCWLCCRYFCHLLHTFNRYTCIYMGDKIILRMPLLKLLWHQIQRVNHKTKENLIHKFS